MPFSPVQFDAVGHTRPRRWLCVCERGNCRSVHLAAILKDSLNQDAIAIGITAATPFTQEMLGEWADHVVLVDENLAHLVPASWQSKLMTWDVGEDRFFQGWNKTLYQLFSDFLGKYVVEKKQTEQSGR